MTRIRPCGMSWSYCDGRCEKCQSTATANTPIVTTPTNYCDNFYKGYCGKYQDGCFHQCEREDEVKE